MVSGELRFSTMFPQICESSSPDDSSLINVLLFHLSPLTARYPWVDEGVAYLLKEPQK
jgi:hypothetical protein